jgi:hypothetical protein
MADNPINISQLRTACDHFITAEYPYYEELREAFKLLKLTGCRIQEIFDISRWSIVSGYMVSFTPQKHNNARIITLNADFNNFLAAIQNQHAPFLGRTYSQLQNLFDRINPYGKLFSGGKEITNYIYRYLYVRELMEAGLTIQQTADIMGYHSTTAVSNYLNADLDSTIEIPAGDGIVIDGKTYRTWEFNDLIWIAEPLQYKYRDDLIYDWEGNADLISQNGLLYHHSCMPSLLDALPSSVRCATNSEISAYHQNILKLTGKFNNLKHAGSDAWLANDGLQTTPHKFWGSGLKGNSEPYYLKERAYIINPNYGSGTSYSFYYLRSGSESLSSGTYLKTNPSHMIVIHIVKA